MAVPSPRHRTFLSPDSSWYRERRDEEWSPRSLESDHEPSFDSDEENRESKMITVHDSSSARSSMESSPLVPWSQNAPFSPLTRSSSLVSYSQGSNVNKEDGMVIQQYVAKSTSLVMGKRPRALGLKDIDLTTNLTARHIREAKEANKSPKKKQDFSPLTRHFSCPAFSSINGSSMGPSDRLEITGKTGLGRDLNLDARSRLHVRSSATQVERKEDSRRLWLFSCPEEQTSTSELCISGKLNKYGLSCKLDSQKASNTTGTRNTNSTGRAIEVIDLTSSEGTSECEINDVKDQLRSQSATSNVGDAGVSHSPLKRRPSKLSFSDDEDSDSNEQYSWKSVKEESKQPAKADEEITPRRKHPAKVVLKMGFFFALGALLLSMYLHINPHGFCLESEFSRNISGIGKALKSELYGQHIAQKVITVALKNHFNKNNARKPLVFSFHGWTGTGKNFVSNIITEHIFKYKMQSPFVHKFIIPLHFPHESEVNTYNEQLLRWIRGNVSHCRKGGLFIFDEMDKIHPGMTGTIKDAILDFRGKSTSDGYQNMVFIFLSNSGGHAINNHVLRHVFDGKLRESLTLSQLENIFYGIIKQIPHVWFADLVKSDVIDHLVPFLPLERTHVKQCIRQDLSKKGFQVKEARVKDIADQMDYFPQGHEFFSVSGCKKVSSRVDVTMG